MHLTHYLIYIELCTLFHYFHRHAILMLAITSLSAIWYFGESTMTEKRDEKFGKIVTWPQWTAGFAVLLLVTQLGLMVGWSSPHIAHLTSPDAPFSVTILEVSWVISALNFGRPFGAIIGALYINYLGSKAAIVINCIPISLYWLLIILANNVQWLFAARFLGGIGIGMIYACYSLYLGEIAHPRIRGALVALGTTGHPIGTLIISIMGAYLRMQISAMLALVFSVALMVLFIWLPESPYHLIKRNLDQKAKASIRWYHRGYDTESEFIRLRKFVENLNKQSWSDILKELKTVQFCKSMLMISVLIAYGQLSGINSILFYMETILTSAKVSMINPTQVVIIVMACGVVGSCFCICFMDRYGKKVLMIVSCTGITLSLSLLTLEFHLLNFGFDPKTVEGVAIVAIISFYTSVYVGAISVGPAMLGEIFPPHLKSIAACFTSVISGVVAFTCSSTYVPLLDLLSERYLFLFYGLIIGTAVPFTVFCIPETKGMSLQEIQSHLTKNKEARTTDTSTDTEKISREKNVGSFVITYSS